MKRSFLRWLVCAGCTIELFCTVGLASNCFSIFQPYLISSGALSHTQASSLVTIRLLFGLLAVLILERYLKLVGLRAGLLFAIFGCAVSFALFAVAKSYTAYCAAAALAGLCYGLGGVTTVSILMHSWFDDRLATALGVCFAGTGIAVIAVPTVLTAVIEKSGLAFAFWMNAAFVGICSVCLLPLLRDRPDSSAALAAGPSKKREAGGNAALTVGRRDYFLTILAVAMIGIVANPAFCHLPVLFASVGLDNYAVSYLVSLLGVTLMGGKLIYGIMTDRFGARITNYIFYGLLMTGGLGCCFAGRYGFPIACGFMLCYGIGMSLASVGVSVLARDVSTGARYDRTARIFQLSYLVGSLAFSTMPGFLADRCGGSYIPAYIVFTALSAVCSALVFRLYRILAQKAPSEQTAQPVDKLLSTPITKPSGK